MRFLDLTHETRFLNLVSQDSTSISDKERFALFYIISGNDDLYRKRNYIYNFNSRSIKHCLTDSEVDFSSGCRALVRLAFNLYNYYKDDYTTPYHLFSGLDDENCKLAINAVKLRFMHYEALEFDKGKSNDNKELQTVNSKSTI